MGVEVQTKHLGPVHLELGTRVRWHYDNWDPAGDDHDGDVGTLCQDGENGPIVVRFNDLCQRYVGHGILEVVA